MKEQDAAHSFDEDRKLPPDNETVEDGGGCYVAGSREDEILAQQNAFHLVKALDLIDECYHYLKANPPDKTKMTYSKWQNLLEETDYMREFNANVDHARHNEDFKLTRLRSELQQERELRKELVECIENYVDLETLCRPEKIESLIKKAKLNN